MDEKIIKVENLSHRYAVQWAVKDINFELPKKGIYGLLGSNGAGKSTVMNIICGVLRPTEGNIYINGINTRIEPIKAKMNIGFLPQTPPLYKDLTVWEFLRFAAGARLMPPKEVPGAIEKVLEKCAITHFKNRLIKNLSGGYQQRVGIAQAIIHEPQVVVFDEPTNGLDPNQTLEIRHLIKEIAEEKTVILSTHILPEIQAACDYIFMMETGNMVFSGTVDEFDNYITPNTLVVKMISAPPLEELMALPNILKVEELGGVKYRFHFSQLEDVAEQFIETSVKKGWRLMDITEEKSSLDSIFAELSKKNK